MPIVPVLVHPRDLGPAEAAKAWYLREKAGMKWLKICSEVRNIKGEVPTEHAVRNAVERMRASGKAKIPHTNYANCGRKSVLTEEQQRQIVAFVKRWRNKRFCTCKYVRQELKLKASRTTILRVLNSAGFFWRAVAKKQPLTTKQMKARREFVDRNGGHGADWWTKHVGLVFDGVTLTKAPKALSARQKHAAQSITHMWMRRSEKMDPTLHTHNRYGIQLGEKVPLWGGFTGSGDFTLRLWTPTPKMNKTAWAKLVPALGRAAMLPQSASQRRANVWHDNETFLNQPDVYKKHGMISVKFPPNSGDLNPIETVWARLRRDLAVQEMEDLQAGRSLSTCQYKRRASLHLTSYGVPQVGESISYLSRLLRGMPRRLAKCKANRYGPCGK